LPWKQSLLKIEVLQWDFTNFQEEGIQEDFLTMIEFAPVKIDEHRL
jgi:hypothetical protein